MGNYAIKNGVILDGTIDMEPIYDKIILVKEDKIEAIVSKDYDTTGFEEIDLKGKFILPGLINLHVHLAGAGGKPKKKQSDPVKLVNLVTANKLTRRIGKALVANYAKTELLSGTTTIRTVGGIADFDTYTRNQIDKGLLVGPRILASNKAVSVPGGHFADSLGYSAKTPEEAAKYVEIIAKDKPDLIKLMITGGVLDATVVGEPGALRMAPELVKAACDKAHELGLIVAAHVESTEGVKVALENGVDSIEHGGKPTKELTRLFKEKNAFQVATISPALPSGVFDVSDSGASKEHKINGMIVFEGVTQMAIENLKNQIPVGLGTDTACPFVTHYNMWREVALFSKYCGVSLKFALHTATLLNARLAGIDNITGSIEANKSADMIVVDENPLENIRTLSNVRKVFFRGKLYDKPVIKKNLEVEQVWEKYL